MPTARPRVLVTETDDLAAALQLAARAWPQERSRARLLTRLALLGGQRLAEPSHESRLSRRTAALEQHAGRFAGVFPPGYREALRDEWPE
ncbi:hypothetical protein MWU75_09585 [Ornithinimicrobium sp. F0845]|uniref:hypothetical protein n=1 Tax=Ornithinimicrobium sp. F0845 TaxID=2926412 RepID=UPI001FF0ED81|nr:hypothetical protein [Ornithinimicrobium sp. F0845]MCK0112387.1 hypothetical protein [Ornithinimicrobium sp. F0845]